MARKHLLLINRWQLWLGENPSEFTESFKEASDLLAKEGQDFYVKNSRDRSDCFVEVGFTITNESVLNGYDHNDRNYDHWFQSPVRWYRWAGHVYPSMALMAPSEFERVQRAWTRNPDAADDWWSSRYRAGLADPNVIKLRRGMVLTEAGERLTLEDVLLERFGQP